MLSHANIFYQVDKFDFFVRLGSGDQTLSLLPPWHIYERAVGYYIFSCGCKQVLAPGGSGHGALSIRGVARRLIVKCLPITEAVLYRSNAGWRCSMKSDRLPHRCTATSRSSGRT